MAEAQSILGFDFGKQHIGIAIGNRLTGQAQALGSLKARDGIPDWQQIQRLLAEWQPDALVVGLPLNMDGSEQPMTQAARKFGQRLHGRFQLPVFWLDERLTSAEAREILFEQRGYKALAKQAIDGLAAALMVESFFSSGPMIDSRTQPDP